jgi:hypothetical protein
MDTTTIKDHEKHLKRTTRFYFEYLVKEYKNPENNGLQFFTMMDINDHIKETKVLAESFPCLWDLVTEMESDLMSEVR